jgi:hypothetical protein
MPALTEETLREILTEHLEPTGKQVATLEGRADDLTAKAQADLVERKLLQQTVETGFAQVSARLEGLHTLAKDTNGHVNRHETQITVQRKLCEERHKPGAAPVPAAPAAESTEHVTLTRKHVMLYGGVLIAGGALVARVSPEAANLVVYILKHIFSGGS